MSRKLSQNGFSAVEALLLIVIVALIAGVGYFVYHSNQNANDTLKSTSSATQTNVSKAVSVISLDKTKVPTGWKVVVDNPSTLSMAEPPKCTALVSQTADKSLTVSGAQAFINRKVTALSLSSGSNTSVVGTAADQTVGGQTVSMYPVTVKEKGQVTANEKVGYVVGKGYFVSVIENCADVANLPQADQALQAVTIKQ